ncbi:hypothetical protein CRUP_017513 [Coryphaenoides rupestris]|nr:hypothetical protein CRUP_017513 [Coryphaenoides rupestris]
MKTTIERSSWHTGLVVLSGNFVIDSCAMCMDDMDATDTKTTLSTATNYPTKHKDFASKIKWKTIRQKKYAGRRRSDADRRRGDAIATPYRRRSDADRRRSDADRRASLDVTLTRKDAHARSHAQRPMAPQNTTQYLMAANVYADMSPQQQQQQQQHGDTSSVALDVYGESLSPASFSAALDAVYYDDYLAFQQRDFEEVLGRL